MQLPGDTYRLTIVPDDYSYNVTVTDNNADVTANVQRKEEEITKDGVTTTVVNFIYTLTNIQATHNIVVMCSPNEALYIKINGSYVMAHAIYRKVNGSWTQVSLDTLTDETIYVRP